MYYILNLKIFIPCCGDALSSFLKFDAICYHLETEKTVQEENPRNGGLAAGPRTLLNRPPRL